DRGAVVGAPRRSMAKAAGGGVRRGLGGFGLRLSGGAGRPTGSERCRARHRGRIRGRVPVGAAVGGAGLAFLPAPPMSFLRLWLLATMVLLAAVVWGFAPVLVVLALLTVGLGGVSLVMITLARGLARLRGRPRFEDRNRH